MRFSSFSLPGCALLLASSLFAQGVVIVESRGPAQGSGATAASRVHIEGDRLFILNEGDGGKQGVVFLGGSKVIRMLDYGNNTYREMTEQDLQQMGAQMGDAMANARKMMEEKMKDMPPQQRQMIEQMMKQKMGAAAAQGPQTAAAPVVYTKVASGQTIRQWTCDKYEGVREGQKVWEVCAVDFAQFGVQPADLRVFEGMAEMFKNLAPQGMEDAFKVGFDGTEREGAFRGVPVQRVSFRNGAPNQLFEVTEVTRQDVDDALFEVPSGFQKVDMPRPGMRGR
jgi:hypothetical protein